MTEKREYEKDVEPIAMEDRDPSNSQPEEFTAPLDPDDDVLQRLRLDEDEPKQ